MSEETMITSCPHCHWKFRVSTSLADTNGKCTKCGNTFRVDEFLEEPEIYKPPRREVSGGTDDVLAPPVRPPSYPSLKAIAGGQRRQRENADEDDGRTAVPEGQNAPNYWVLRAVALGNFVLGLIVISGGCILLAWAIMAARVDARAVTVAYAIGLIISGAVLAAVGQALAALRDMAINSFLSLDR